MQKIINLTKKNFFVLLVILLTIPSFFRMLQFGMYSTQDFHIFRLTQFDKCIQDLDIPCRWAPDAGLGYGEPLFNFYGQFPYLIGELFYLVSGSLINSVKFLFIFSLAGSAISMYFLGKSLWKSEVAGILSAVLYIYAPYRAVDVWVRGALPEAMAFVIFPLLILAVEKKSIKWLSVLMAALVTTHNLSFIMFLPLLVAWIVYRKFWRSWISFLIAGLLAAFYILPVIFESKYIDIESTTRGYFDFHNHFATINQLFISNFWGYGASQWGPKDDISMSIGYLQWSLPVLIALIFLIKKEILKHKEFVLLLGAGLVYLFMTHNKSTLVWESLSFLKYIQFPWRFLGIIVFCLSLASGILVSRLPKSKTFLVLIPVMFISIFINLSFFRPDLWFKVTDEYYLTGVEWDRQRIASIGDFWPDFGHDIPDKPSDGKYINYFPGWVSVVTPEDGLIPSDGSYFTDTPIRRWGNIISLLSLLGLIGFSKKWTKKA